MASLGEPAYLKFPFSVSTAGPETSSRPEHVREQIEQVLFTDIRERVFRPEFGVGIRRLVFEPNNVALRNSTLKRLNASLAEALHGEVDPRTLVVDIGNDEEKLVIHVAYILAALNKRETHAFAVDATGGSNG